MGLAMRALVKDLHEWQKRYIDHLSISNNMYFYNYEYFKVESIKLLLNKLGVEHLKIQLQVYQISLIILMIHKFYIPVFIRIFHG